MKFKAIVLGIFCFFIFSAFPSHAATKLKKLGTNPFYKTTDLKAEDIYPLLVEHQKDLKTGFISAGAIDLFEPFMAQVKSTMPEPFKVQPGDTLLWMIFKKKNKPVVINDVIWAGKKPFQGYRVTVRHKGSDYEFVIPEICFNISLKSISDVPAPPPPPPPKPKETVEPAKEVKEQPAPVVTQPEPTPVVAEQLPRQGFFVGDMGLYEQPDPATFAFFRVGYMHKFNDKAGLTGFIGIAPLLEGCEDNPAILADAIFTYDVAPKFFLGAGVGVWHTSFKTRADLLLEAGYYLTQEPKGPNFALFVEARSALDQMDDIAGYGRFGGGFRIYY